MKKLRISQDLSDLINNRRIVGLSQRKISEELNIPKSTVAWHFQKQRENIRIGFVKPVGLEKHLTKLIN